LGAAPADFKSNSRAAASSAMHKDRPFRGCGTTRCSASGDIHKNLWISLWIIAE
jgi:hypothetical protein